MKTLTITRPDDWHLHIRNGAVLKTVLPHTARQFARAIIMPNLKPPVTTVAQALLYREEILQALPADVDFTPLMTLYLTGSTTVAEIKTGGNSLQNLLPIRQGLSHSRHGRLKIGHDNSARELSGGMRQYGF